MVLATPFLARSMMTCMEHRVLVFFEVLCLVITGDPPTVLHEEGWRAMENRQGFLSKALEP